LATEAAIAKRLTRAKKKSARHGFNSEIQQGDIGKRLDVILQSLYLLSMKATRRRSDQAGARGNLPRGDPAGWIAGEHTAGTSQNSCAAALMLMNAARFPTRLMHGNCFAPEQTGNIGTNNESRAACFICAVGGGRTNHAIIISSRHRGLPLHAKNYESTGLATNPRLVRPVSNSITRRLWR